MIEHDDDSELDLMILGEKFINEFRRFNDILDDFRRMAADCLGWEDKGVEK